jgi:CubicO group peptidase (beta-lactamase class C family)
VGRNHQHPALRQRHDAIAVFKDDALLFEPGTKYSYSTQGYVLLGGAIENVSGIPYLQYLQERIFAPAGMTHTAADDASLNIPNRAVGYRRGLFGFGWLSWFRGVHVAPPHDTASRFRREDWSRRWKTWRDSRSR